MERMYTFAPRSTLRSRPCADAEALQIIPPRMGVEVVAESDNFYRVRYQDENGAVMEGYVAKSLLQPSSPLDDSVQEVVDHPRMAVAERLFSVPSANTVTKWLVAGLALLFVSNLVSSFVLWRGIADLRSRSYHVSCSGSSYRVPTYTWGKLEQAEADSDYYQNGQALARFVYQVSEKIPGSRIILRYQIEGEQEWKERVMRQEQKPLQFLASFLIDPAKLIQFDVLQMVNGEVVRADLEHNLQVGNGDLAFGLRQVSGGERQELYFYQHPWPTVHALQVERIEVRISGKNSEWHIVEDRGDGYLSSVVLPNLDFNSMEIQVIYRDGTERKVEIASLSPEPMVIRR